MDTEAETVHEETASPEEVQAVENEALEGEEQTQEQPVEQKEEEKVPLSALQKERRKRQEAEKRAKLFEDLQEKQLREQPQAQPQEEEDIYEAVTKADLSKSKKEIVRAVEESTWVKQNPEKALEINEKLQEFLTQRPNLSAAIEGATNRYEEAWTLMDALSPRQQKALSKPQAQKKDAPGSPGAAPKAAGMNQAADVWGMTDSEYSTWRRSQIKQRR